MKPFLEMDYIVNPDGGENIPILLLKENDPLFVGIYRNDKYQVWIRKEVVEEFPCNMIWLSIKRIDKEVIHDWRELQEIKNMLVGKENEGIELYPAESRVTDLANQFHIYVLEDPKLRFPFGFIVGLVSDEETKPGELGWGSKQRKFSKEDKTEV